MVDCEIGQRCIWFDDVPEGNRPRRPRVLLPATPATHSQKRARDERLDRDAFNLGWKLAVLHGTAAPHSSYLFDERQTIAKELIKFDRAFAN